MKDLDAIISEILMPHVDSITKHITDVILEPIIDLVCDEMQFSGDRVTLKEKLKNEIKENVEKAKERHGDKL